MKAMASPKSVLTEIAQRGRSAPSHQGWGRGAVEMVNQIEIIPKSQIPSPRWDFGKRKQEIQVILQSLERLPSDRCIKFDAGSQKSAKYLQSNLQYYHNRRGRRGVPEISRLKMSIRGQFVFCWLEEGDGE